METSIVQQEKGFDCGHKYLDACLGEIRLFFITLWARALSSEVQSGLTQVFVMTLYLQVLVNCKN